MVRWERYRSARSVSHDPRKQWVPKVRDRLSCTDDPPASGVGEAAVAAGGVLGEAAVAAGGADAAPTLQEAVRRQDCPCTLSGEEEQEVDEIDGRSVWSMTTLRQAVIIAAWSGPDDMLGLDDDEAAVAADDCPTRFITRYSTRQPRDCTPDQHESKSTWAGRNDASHVGNTG